MEKKGEEYLWNDVMYADVLWPKKNRVSLFARTADMKRWLPPVPALNAAVVQSTVLKMSAR